MERPVVRHYNLPTVSYREAVWPDFAKPSNLLPCFWNGYSHPDAVGHLLMGDVVTYGLIRALIDGHNAAGRCGSLKPETPPRFHQRLQSPRYCVSPNITSSNSTAIGTYMTPAQPESFRSVGVTGAWTFREDRPKKPGEIGK
jgi:hypothetical protein